MDCVRDIYQTSPGSHSGIINVRFRLTNQYFLFKTESADPQLLLNCDHIDPCIWNHSWTNLWPLNFIKIGKFLWSFSFRFLCLIFMHSLEFIYDSTIPYWTELLEKVKNVQFDFTLLGDAYDLIATSLYRIGFPLELETSVSNYDQRSQKRRSRLS